MSRPAPVSAYNSLEAFRLHYSWQVPGYHAGTTDGCACISPFSGINCTRLYNNHLPECFHILSGQFPVSHGIVFRIRRLFPDLVRVAAGIHFGSGPFSCTNACIFLFQVRFGSFSMLAFRYRSTWARHS